MRKAIKKVSLVALTLITAIVFILGISTYNKPVQTLAEVSGQVYGIDFSDSANRGDNKVGSLADATIVGTGVTYTENAINGKTAINFPGGGVRQNYISIDKEVINNDVVTFAAWMKLNSNPQTWARPISVYKDGSNRLEIMPVTDASQNTVLNISLVIGGKAFSNKGYDSITSGTTSHTNWGGTKNFPANNLQMVYGGWAHYAYTFEVDKVSYFINGELCAQFTLADMTTRQPSESFSLKQLYSENTKVALGATHTDNTADWKGSIADFKVYNKALTETELKEISGISTMSYKEFLVSHYDFEDANNPGLDKVRGLNGTLKNTAKVENNTTMGNVLKLDGAGSSKEATMLELDSKVIRGLGQFTVSVNVNIDSSAGGWARIFDFAPGAAQQMVLAIRWGGASSDVLNAKYTMDETGTNTRFEVKSTYNDWGKWHNVAVTADGTTTKVYIDGVLVASGDMPYNPRMFSNANDTKLTFGGTYYSGDKGTPCSMDDIRIYSTVLTADQIATDYADDLLTKAGDVSVECDDIMCNRLDGSWQVFQGFDMSYEIEGSDDLSIKTIPEDLTLTVKRSITVAGVTRSLSNDTVLPGTWVDAQDYDCATKTNGNVKHYKCICGKTYDANFNEIDPTVEYQHDHVLQAQDDAGCVTTGVKEHYTCNDCDAYFDIDKNEVSYNDLIIPAHGLTFVEATTAGCITEGTQAHYYCEVCDIKYQDENATDVLDDLASPALGHGTIDGAVVFEYHKPTCTEPGNKECLVCETCGMYFVESDIFNTVDYDYEIPATGHGQNGHTDYIGFEPDCVNPGAKPALECNDCGELYLEADIYTTVYVDVELLIPANGHDYVLQEGEPATCTDDGIIKHFSCNDCDCVFDLDKVEIFDITDYATGHDYVWHTYVAPTCTEDGVEAHYTCNNCDLLFDDNYEVVESVKIPFTGHSLKWYEGKPATCVKDGTVGYFKCDVCKVKLDENKYELEDLVDYATGHDLVWHEEVPATCTTSGCVAHFTCNGCDMTFDADKNAIGRLEILPEHDLVWHEGKGASCDEDGYIAHNTCKNCDKTFNKYGEEIADIKVSLDHSLVYVQGYAPTCTKEGVAAHYKCEYCGDLYDTNKQEIDSVTIPVVEHDYSSDYLVSADGHRHQCEDCSALGEIEQHDYKDGVCACGVKDPAKKDGCNSAVNATGSVFGFALVAILGAFVISLRKLRKR